MQKYSTGQFLSVFRYSLSRSHFQFHHQEFKVTGQAPEPRGFNSGAAAASPTLAFEPDREG